jgi:hypothetical protein
VAVPHEARDEGEASDFVRIRSDSHGNHTRTAHGVVLKPAGGDLDIMAMFAPLGALAFHGPTNARDPLGFRTR